MSNTITNGNYYYSQSAFVQSAHYYSNQTFGNNDFQSAVIKKDEDSSELVDALAKEEPAKKGYTRVITANVWNSGMTSMQLADDKTAYSYQGVMQKFEIRIDVMGDSRKYTATGTDENGKEFSKEIDPYNVDPTDSDFTEFAALCSYIRDTEGIADEAMQAVDGVAPYDIFEKKNYLSELNGSINNFKMMGVSTLGAEQLLSHINRLMEVMTKSGVGTGFSPEPVENVTSFAGAKVWGDTGSFGMFSGISYRAVSYQGALTIDCDQKADAQKTVEVSDNDNLKEFVTPLGGMSSIPVGNMSYVMTASEVFKPGSDEPIVRVHVGGKDIDVNIKEVDPKNASAVEMFAYCQYADAHDTGTGYTFGSYSVLKGVTDPLGKSEYTSLDEAISKKSNWNDAISESKASFTKEQIGETFDSSVLLKMLEETEAERTKRLIQENLKNGKITKAMDGYEFIKMQGELIERNIEKLRQNQKTTRERLFEQDPNAASKWYMYGNGNKRYTFDEFCKFMDDMDAELRANAPEFKNPYFEMANYYLNKRRV